MTRRHGNLVPLRRRGTKAAPSCSGARKGGATAAARARSRSALMGLDGHASTDAVPAQLSESLAAHEHDAVSFTGPAHRIRPLTQCPRDGQAEGADGRYFRHRP
ncbi:hypothetical protein GCM10017688_59740 [Streptomyces ramulosus]